MQISVVIPSKNGLLHLKECLPSVVQAAGQARDEVRIVVVDDHSTDGTAQEFSRLFPTVFYCQNEGFGAGDARNTGVKAFACDWIVFLDNDVLVDPDFFNTLGFYLKPDLFCVTCAGYKVHPTSGSQPRQLDGIKLISWKKGFPRFDKNIFNSTLPQTHQTPYPSYGIQGAYFACNRSCFDQLNGFDPLFSPYMLEETDLMYRGLKRGWKIVYAPDTAPLHKWGSTIHSKTNQTTRFLSKRNRILFVWKNITDKKLLFNHGLWMLMRPTPVALWACIRLWPQIRRARAQQLKNSILTDRTILSGSHDLFKTLRERKKCK
ncbi:MAG: glycosyltransferase [Elusimicrobiaceae bacterium]|nr:glycosyltransferase [Elusimicrobiaceae bacterium]